MSHKFKDHIEILLKEHGPNISPWTDKVTRAVYKTVINQILDVDLWFREYDVDFTKGAKILKELKDWIRDYTENNQFTES